MEISYRDIKHMINESINLLNEKMEVWGDKDVNEFINIIYREAKEIADKCEKEYGFTYKEKGKYLYKIPKWKPMREYSVEYLNQEMKVKVYYNCPPYERAEGIHYDTHIELYIPYGVRYSTIQNIVYHEFNHEFSDRMQDKIKSSYYNDETMDLGIKAQNGWRKWSNEWVKAVDEILYRLWSREERDSYIAMSTTENVENIRSYIDKLQKDIDILKKSGITFSGSKNSEGKPYDEIFWERVKYLVNKQGYKVGDMNKGIYNMTWEKFKKIFIKRSQDILNKYSKRLINNWYYYQTNLNNGKGIENYKKDNEGEDYFNKGKEYIITHIDNIVEGLCYNETSKTNIRYGNCLVYDDGKVKIYIMPNRKIVMKMLNDGNGMKRSVQVPTYVKKTMGYINKDNKSEYTFYIHNDKQYNAIYKGNNEERFNTVKKLILNDLK